MTDFIRHRENLPNVARDKNLCLSDLPFLCLIVICISPKLWIWMSPFAPLGMKYCCWAEFTPSQLKDYWPLKPNLHIDFGLYTFSCTINHCAKAARFRLVCERLSPNPFTSKPKPSRHFPANRTSLALSFCADIKKYFLPFPYNNPVPELFVIEQGLHGALWAVGHQEATKQSEISRTEHTLPLNYA